MGEAHPCSEFESAHLLDQYLTFARHSEPDALAATALRTRTHAVRRLVAHAVAEPPCPLDRLLAAARARRPETLAEHRIDPAALADLIRVITLQALRPEDEADGMALSELLLRLAGPDAAPRRQQRLHAQLAFHRRDYDYAEQLLSTYRGIPSEYTAALRVDLANPFCRPGQDATTWLAAFQRLLPEPGLVLRDEGTLPPFDRLSTEPGTPIVDGDLVTVIVTTYRPGIELLTAVRSVIEQTWTRLEIIVVDDGSPGDYDPVLKECAELDERVRLVKLSDNRGTYIARNTGLDLARGGFVTFQDSDDWSHPRRIEHQVREIEADDTLVATLTDGLRVDERLVFNRPGRLHRLLNTSSLLFRRAPVLHRIGYLDQVRKAADTEYVRRIETVFGAGAVRHLGKPAYALIRLSNDSLSRSDFRTGWMHPERFAYRSAYATWHQKIKDGTSSPYLPRQQFRRQFRAPAGIAPAAGHRGEPRYDVILVSDWRPGGAGHRAAVEEARILAAAGMRVGIVHVESLRAMTRRVVNLHQPVQELVNRGDIDLLLLSDDVRASLVLIRDPSVLQFAAHERSRIQARRTVIVADEPPSELASPGGLYGVAACTSRAGHIFDTDPRWSATTPSLRQSLAAAGATSWTATPVPIVVDVERWRVDRRRARLDRPVIGRSAPDEPRSWPADPDTLLAVLPASPDIDVRLSGGAAGARRVLGSTSLPPNWVDYAPGETSPRSFLNQLEFFVFFPHPTARAIATYDIVEALASGCVTLLPSSFAGTFGDAARYCAPEEVNETVRRTGPDTREYREQSSLAQGLARDLFSPQTYVKAVGALTSE